MFRSLFNKKSKRAGMFYLFLIIAFSVFYYSLPPGYISYKVNVESNYWTNLYFSIVTITTLGFGDITPIHQTAILLVGLQSLLGIVTIGIYLNYLSSELTINAQEAEKLTIQKIQKIKDIENFLRFEKILKISIKEYIEYSLIILTPVEMRKNIENRCIKDIKFNDMKDLFKPSHVILDDPYKPAIEKYYEKERKIKENFEKIILESKSFLIEDIEEDIIKMLATCSRTDCREHILSSTKYSAGDKKIPEIVEKMIKEFRGEVEPKEGSNLVNNYIFLYNQIKLIDSVITKYERIVLKWKKELIDLI